MVSALWARALLAMLVVLDFVIFLVHAVTMEDFSDVYLETYQSCISDPSVCAFLCAARLPPSLSLGRTTETQECSDVRRGWVMGSVGLQVSGRVRPHRNHPH